ncbi:MAG: hypothetical protein CVV51_06155 [Spirochaetae bacterium HGW-Spirochaetae-7]|nr:MAG: hypothetical protein CVV51_06155 [Spirochaetae bacterium HGW-Spirochaetae-7]
MELMTMMKLDCRSFLKRYYIITILFIAMPSQATTQEQGSKMVKWFSNSKCNGLLVSRYRSGQGPGPVQLINIIDKNAIARLMMRIESISPDGDMMKSLLIDEELRLAFECENGETVIKIYDGRFKTPTTGFNSNKKDKDLEAKVYQDIRNLFNPVVGERMLLVQGLLLEFPEFSFTFQGTEVRLQQLGEPTIGPISTDNFLVKPKSGHELSLKVVSGQLPPLPFAFEVGEKEFVLFTFMDEAGERLDPDHFMIELKRR